MHVSDPNLINAHLRRKPSRRSQSVKDFLPRAVRGARGIVSVMGFRKRADNIYTVRAEDTLLSQFEILLSPVNHAVQSGSVLNST